MFSYNATYNSTIQMSPYKAMLGIDPTLSTDILETYIVPNFNYSNFAHQSLNQFKRAHQIITETIKEETRKNIERRNQKRKASIPFKLHDIVLWKNPTIKGKLFIDRYLGPYEIIRVYNNVNVVIKSLEPPYKTAKTVMSQLKLYKRPTSSEPTDKDSSDSDSGPEGDPNDDGKPEPSAPAQTNLPASPPHHRYNLRPRIR